MTSSVHRSTLAGSTSFGFDLADRCTPVLVEALEPRQMLAFIAQSGASPLFDSLGVSTSNSAALLAAPLASGVSLFDAFTSASSNTAASRSLIGLDRFSSDARFRSITGTGFSSVILDTGIDLNHPFFGPDADNNGVADRIVYQYDFADNDSDASDRNGHGSNVASIVGSSDAAYPGVAPGSNLIVLKVFGDSGGGNFGVIERALQWVIANASRFNIASVNLSLGDSSAYSSQQQRYGIGDELAALAQQNIITVAAAGNSFYDLGSVQGVSYPAADPSVLAVGAVYSAGPGGFTYGGGARANTTGAGRLTPFSQRSTTVPTYFAPGAPITGAGATGGTVTMHGTSQASPMLAGVVTLAQQLATSVLQRRLTLAEVRSLLNTSSVNIIDGDDEDDNVTNTGATFKRVDVVALGEAILNLAANRNNGGTPSAPAQPNRKPTLSFVRTLVGAVSGRASTISYELLADAANEADPDRTPLSFRIETVAAAKGTLLKNGVPVVGRSTTLSAGESLTYVPGAKVTGTVSAFTIVASDGVLVSAKPVTVSIKVAKPTSFSSSATLMPRSADVVGESVPMASQRVERIALQVSTASFSALQERAANDEGVVLRADSILTGLKIAA